MPHNYKADYKKIPSINRLQTNSVSSTEDLYEDKIIYYLVIKAAESNNNFVVLNGKESYEKCDGRILRNVWKFLAGVFDNCELKDCNIRSDEFHGIVLIDRAENTESALSNLLAEFKSLSTNLINNYRSTFGKPLWENVFQLDVVSNYTELFNIITTRWEQ